MFGYIRPERGELKIKEYELFRGVYCGLCHALGRRCGFAARFTVNYDFTFLALLTSRAGQTCTCRKRCIANPLRRRGCCESTEIDAAADYSLILTWWKLRDALEDGSLKEKLAARAAMAFLRRGYKKAAARLPDFSESTRRHLSDLTTLERGRESSIDKTADCFAAILAAVSDGEQDDIRRRALHQIFYHTGRIVYILDAVDDLEEDMKKDLYNPLRYRFSLSGRGLSAEEKETIRITLQHSMNMLGSAFELLENNPWTEVLGNIIYLGIPAACDQVLAGTWGKQREHTSRSIL